MRIDPREAKFILAALSKDETRPQLMLPFVAEVSAKSKAHGGGVEVTRWLCATDGHRLHAVKTGDKVPLGTAAVTPSGQVGFDSSEGYQHPPVDAVWCHKSKPFKAEMDSLDMFASTRHASAMLGVGFGCGEEIVPLRLYRANSHRAEAGFGYYNVAYVRDALLAVPRSGRRGRTPEVSHVVFGMTADNGDPISMSPMVIEMDDNKATRPWRAIIMPRRED